MASSLLNKNVNNFWKGVKNVSGVKSGLPSTVDNVNGEENISNLFANKYNAVYNSVSYDVDDMTNLLFSLENDICQKCNSSECYYNHVISVEQINSAIKLLKPHKSDGDLGHSSDHIINGSLKLSVYLCCYSMLC